VEEGLAPKGLTSKGCYPCTHIMFSLSERAATDDGGGCLISPDMQVEVSWCSGGILVVDERHFRRSCSIAAAGEWVRRKGGTS
jgi:hypothetical protein